MKKIRKEKEDKKSNINIMKYLVLVRMDGAYFHLKLEEAHLTDSPTDYNLKLWTKHQKQLPGTCTKADTL